MVDKYLMDANIFITSHRQYYSFDIAPSFWDQIVEKVSDKIVIIEKVKDELQRGPKGTEGQYSCPSVPIIFLLLDYLGL